MKPLPFRFLPLLALLLTLQASTAGATDPKTSPAPARLSPNTPQGLEGGFWKTEANFDPILRFKNILLKQSLDVTPSLFFADGTEYQLPVVHLVPAGVAEVNIRYAIQDAPATLRKHISSFGMAGVSYQWSWPALIMTIQNQDAIASVDSHSTALADTTKVHAALKTSESQQIIRGTWWTPTATADGYIALQNPSLTPKQVDLELSDHSGTLLTHKIETVPVHGTLVYKLTELLGYAPNPDDSGDITLRYSGVAHGVVAAVGLEDPTTGFSATPHLTEQHQDLTKPDHAVTIQAPGLMIGEPDPAMLFPVGLRFVPFTVLHNVSTHPVVATISLTSETPNGTPATRTLGTISLAAGQSQSVDYSKFPGSGLSNPILPASAILPRASLLDSAHTIPVPGENHTPFAQANSSSIPGAMQGGFANISIGYQGREGDLMADVGSMDQSGNYVFEVAPIAAGPSIGKILCFWELRNNRDTMISVWNYTSAAQDLQLVLLYWGGQYRIPIHLEANKTYNLDMMTLIHSRIPDPDGVLIPSNITTGSAILTGKGGEADIINVATSGATFSPLEQDCNIICSNCESYSEVTLDPGSPILPFGSSLQLSATGKLSTGSTFTPGGSWASSNSAVASVTSAGLLTAVGAGSATLSFNAVVPAAGIACGDEECPWETVDVQEPVGVDPKVTVNTSGTTPYGQLPTISATVSSNTGPTPTGSVKFSMTPAAVAETGDINLAANGTASWDLATLDGGPLLAIGDYTVNVSYSGDDTYNEASGSNIFAIGHADSTASITCPTTSVAGQYVSIGVSVTYQTPPTATGAAEPTGQVILYYSPYSGPTSTATGNLTLFPFIASTATFSIPLPTVSTYTVKASYQGDSNYVGNTSGTCAINVTAAQ